MNTGCRNDTSGSSAGQLEIARRHDAADTRAVRVKGHHATVAQDVRDASTTAASTATLVQAIVDRMDYNHEDSLQWEASATKVALATATLASRTADEERWTIL